MSAVLGPKPPQAHVMEALPSYALWQQRPGSSCNNGTDTACLCRPQPTRQLSDKAWERLRHLSYVPMVRKWLIHSWKWNLPMPWEAETLPPSLATKPNRRPICHEPAAPMPPFAQPLPSVVSSKLMRSLGLPWLAHSDARATETSFQCSSPWA